MKKINFKGVKLETWVRTVVLAIALVNQALVVFGVTDNEVGIESWANYATYILTAISSVWSWWKNNSFTDEAQQADLTLTSKG